MRTLIIHNETVYFGGAERMLGHFLNGLAQREFPIVTAVVKESRTSALLPKEAETVWISDNRRFSLIRLWQQGAIVREFSRKIHFDLVHGWAARDWELASLIGRMVGCPAVGTLHDHPRAEFITKSRRFLMRLSAVWGLKKVICVSGAVRDACVVAGYPPNKLVVIRNGLPPADPATPKPDSAVRRLGFLSVFSERKGLRGLFEIFDQICSSGGGDWEMHIGGGTQDEEGERMVRELREQYMGKAWWPRVHWHGWVERVQEFLQSVDVLIVPSREFDPFPTVLLEAGQAGIPVLASRVGGVSEIVDDGKTGWLFEPGDWAGAASKLREHALKPDQRRSLGRQASARIADEFSVGKMVESYLKLYGEIST